MRSSGATYCELPLSVVAWTKFRIACLAAPSFQEASGADCAPTATATNVHRDAATTRARRVDDVMQVLSVASGWRRHPKATSVPRDDHWTNVPSTNDRVAPRRAADAAT